MWLQELEKSDILSLYRPFEFVSFSKCFKYLGGLRCKYKLICPKGVSCLIWCFSPARNSIFTKSQLDPLLTLYVRQAEGHISRQQWRSLLASSSCRCNKGAVNVGCRCISNKHLPSPGNVMYAIMASRLLSFSIMAAPWLIHPYYSINIENDGEDISQRQNKIGFAYL